MNLLALARTLLLPLLLLLSGQASAQALNETYEGLLFPPNFEQPIPITLKLTEAGGLLVGRAKTSSPLAGEAPIASGELDGGKCNLKIVLNSSVTLRLNGSCVPSLFEGTYTVYNTARDTVTRGAFRLNRKEPTAEEKEKEREKTAPKRSLTQDATTPMTACLKANTSCLVACPQGDYNVELLCSNRCRSKFQQCKGRANKL